MIQRSTATLRVGLVEHAECSARPTGTWAGIWKGYAEICIVKEDAHARTFTCTHVGARLYIDAHTHTHTHTYAHASYALAASLGGAV